MLTVKISATQVEDVIFEDINDSIEDYDMIVVWPLVRQHLQELQGELTHAFEHFKKCLRRVDEMEAKGVRPQYAFELVFKKQGAEGKEDEEAAPNL